MSCRFFPLAACAALSLVAFRMSANTYYVAASGGSNDNDGLSLATAWADAWYAVDQAHDGDTIILGDGTHYFPSSTAENLLITNAITVKSVNGPTACRIRGYYWKTATATATRNRRVLNLNNGDAVFSGITIFSASMATRIISSSGSFVVSRCSAFPGAEMILVSRLSCRPANLISS